MNADDILNELKLIAEENGYELTENAEKIAKFRAKSGIDLGKCVCDPKNPYKGCISNLCRKEIEEEKKWVKGKAKIITKYSIYLAFTTIALYLIGDSLSRVLENMARIFNISEFFIGITLGFITSIPELITFFESQKHHKNTKAREGVVEATNNLLTSNVLNLFIIQTIGIVIINLV